VLILKIKKIILIYLKKKKKNFKKQAKNLKAKGRKKDNILSI
jgi:hypothetical protein